MTEYDPEIHHRRSIRLNEYDYSSEGAYFITVCTQNRVFLFGNVDDTGMRLNDAGRMVEYWWLELANKFPNVIPDTHVVMSNHFHGIVIINASVGADLCVCPPGSGNVNTGKQISQMGEHTGSPLHDAPISLSRIIQWFKTMTTNAYIHGVRNRGWKPFDKRLWQRNYYEHIIRDEESHARIAEYIRLNPENWTSDRNNPAVKLPDDTKDEIEEWLESFKHREN